MNKGLKVLLSFIIAILVVLPVVQTNTVEAASKYVDGEHSLPFTVLKDSGNEQSVTNDYMNTPAKLVVKDGKNFVQVTLKNSSWWQYFKVQTGGNLVGVTVLSEGSDTQLVQFEVQDLDQLLNAKVHIIVPDINYDNKYDIRFKFNTANVSVAVVDVSSDKSEAASETGTANSEQENTKTGAEKKEAEKNPKTSDKSPILVLSLVLLASGFVVVRKVVFK